MAFNLVEEIKKKSREEWMQQPREWFTQARIWVQENAEKAFILGVIVGILIFVAFKLVVSLLFLAAVCYIVVLIIAQPAGSSTTTTTGVKNPLDKDLDDTGNEL